MSIIDYPNIFWAIMIGIAGIRMIIPLGNKIMKEALLSSEEEENVSKRNHTLMLASFTIVALTLVVIFAQEKESLNSNSFAFMSVAMFLFFISSYLFHIGYKLWVSYSAETLEYVGIISLATGFLYMVSPSFQEIFIDLIYIGFFVSMIAVVIFELVLSYKHHTMNN